MWSLYGYSQRKLHTWTSLHSPLSDRWKVLVHRDTQQEEEEAHAYNRYKLAVDQQIVMENVEVRKKAKLIASKKRIMERSVDNMFAFIEGAYKSTCPQIEIRMK